MQQDKLPPEMVHACSCTAHMYSAVARTSVSVHPAGGGQLSSSCIIMCFAMSVHPAGGRQLSGKCIM